MSRRIHRPVLRPLPGRDLTWPRTALPLHPVDPPALAAGLAASGYRAFRVAVYRVASDFRSLGHCEGSRFFGVVTTRADRVFVVTDGEGDGCEHVVTAKRRDAARRLAIQEHQERCQPP